MLARNHSASITDVARRARVSRSTVSLVLNSKGNISLRTQKRVLGACERLRYQPHPMARFLPRLRSQDKHRVSSGLFAFTAVIPRGYPATYMEFLNGVARVAAPHHKSIVYQPIEPGMETQQNLTHQFGLDGRLIIGHIDDQVLDRLRSSDAPLVVMGDHQCAQKVWNVHVDSHAAGRMAFEHMWNLGHRRIALFCLPRRVGFQTEFRRGFEDEAARKGAKRNSCPIFGEESGGHRHLEVLLKRSRRPTAVIAIEGGPALHTLKIARGLRLDVPKDLSLLYYGQHGLDPSGRLITHIDSACEEVGRCAMELLLTLHEKPNESPRRILVQPVFVEGETCSRMKK